MRSLIGTLVVCILICSPAMGQELRQLTDFGNSYPGLAGIDDAGNAIFVGTSSNQLGSNPEFALQIMRFDPVSGTATALTDTKGGVTDAVSVSDDGQWLAFVSAADLIGTNPDRSAELYLRRADGSETRQLTSESALDGGSVLFSALAGGGSRVAFVANTDPLGTNPDNRQQVFVVGTDGTGLRQLTSATSGSFATVSISDDGTRVVFEHSGDPLGTNPEGNSEIFAALADGSELRQLTSAIEGSSNVPIIAGGGSKVVFNSDADLTGGNADRQVEVFIVDWEGSGLDQLTSTTALLEFGDPSALAPTITDDGTTVVFFSNHYRFPFTNIDSNFEIWRIGSDGSGLSTLTSSALVAGSVLPIISGDGSRIAFYTFASFGGGSNPDGGIELYAMEGGGGNKVQLSQTAYAFNASPALSPDGTRAVFARDPDPLFGGGQIFTVDAAGGEATQVSDFSAGDPVSLTLADDNSTIVYAREGEIWTMQVDGSGETQLTTGGGNSGRPALAADGSLVAFDSSDDLAGTNADGSREIFVVGIDGTGILQLTSAADGSSRSPRISEDGAWVVFESNQDLDGSNPDGSYEVFRVSSSGGVPVALSADASASSRQPDVDASGSLVAWHSSANPLGTNPELNTEIFVHDVTQSSLSQLTSTTEGASFSVRLSGDGSSAWFASNAPFFEADVDRPVDLFRAEIGSGMLERVSGLRVAGAGAALETFGLTAILGEGLSVARDGERAVFSRLGDYTRGNPDLLPELWLVDREAPASIVVGKEAPTLVSWPVVPSALRYDVIRGAVDELAPGGDLGATVCVENDSADNDTLGSEDPEQPAPGSAFFYLYRGSAGLLAGSGSYGQSSAGEERLPSFGDCLE